MREWKELSLSLALALVLAGLVGLSLGLLGGGGSILAVPILVYVAGIDPHEAVPLSLAIVGGTSVLAALLHRRSGQVDTAAALLFGLSGMAGAILGARLTHLVAPGTLLLIFGGVMLVAGAFMIRGRSEAEGPARPARRLASLIAGFFVGALTGFLGVGGGFLGVPALVLFAGLPMRRAVGTSLVVIAMNSFAGLVGHLPLQGGHGPLLAGFLAVSGAGAFFGERLAGRFSQKGLKRVFGFFVLAIGAFLMFRNWIP